MGAGRTRKRTARALGGAAALTIAAIGAIGAAPPKAAAAGPGETFLAGGLPLADGGLAGGISGSAGDGADAIALSRDGRYVAFVSMADTLSPDAPPDTVNVFRKDRLTGAVELVNRADGAAGAVVARSAFSATISDDGRRVGFITDAALAPGDVDGQLDVYVRDVSTQQTFLPTAGIARPVGDYDLAGNGLTIAISTDARLDAVNDLNLVRDVYRRSVGGGGTVLVSARDGGTLIGDAASFAPAISDDGTWVAFASDAGNLVGGFVDGSDSDVFVREVAANRTHLVSRSTGGASRGSNGENLEPQIAGAPAGGSVANVTVAWSSRATDLHADDTSGDASIYRRDFPGQPELVSRANGGGGTSADSRAHTASISDDGQRIAFSSDATNLGGGDDYYGAYVRDVSAGTTVLASVDNVYALQAELSGDGTQFAWYDQNGVTADSDPDLGGVFARPYASPPAALGGPELVSRPPGTAPYLAPAFYVESPGVGARTVSGDGRYVVFAAYSHRLPGGGQVQQIYRRDTATGAIELVSRAQGTGEPSPGGAYEPSISADGTRVAFATEAALHPDDGGGGDDDVYVRDLAAGTTTLASRADGLNGPKADSGAFRPSITPDGGHVVFASSSGNLGVPPGARHIWIRDLAAGTTRLVDRATGADGAAGNRDAELASASADGRVVVFVTGANNLDPADPAPATAYDVYVRDTVAATTRLVSRRSGADGPKAVGSSNNPAISADGRVVAFETSDDTLAPEGGVWGGGAQIVARDLSTHQNALVSRAPGGAVANDYATDVAIDGDGSTIAFTSSATNLLPDRGGLVRSAVFARDMATGELHGPPAFGLVGNEPQNRASDPALSGDGQCMAFRARGHNAATGPAGDVETAYVHVISGVCPKPLPIDPRTRDPETRDPEARPRAEQRAPAISQASLLRRRFRVGRAPTAAKAAARRGGRGRRRARARRTPAGTAFRFTLSARANVTIAIERRTAGRKVGRQCRRATPRLRRRTACVRWVAVRPALTRGGLDAGRRSVAFSGRIGRRALAPGSYRATLKAANAAGASKPVRLAFTVVRR